MSQQHYLPLEFLTTPPPLMTINETLFHKLDSVKYFNCNGTNISSELQMNKSSYALHFPENTSSFPLHTVVPLHFSDPSDTQKNRYVYDYQLLKQQYSDKFDKENELLIQIGMQVITFTCIVQSYVSGKDKTLYHLVFPFSQVFAEHFPFIDKDSLDSFIRLQLSDVFDKIKQKNKQLTNIVYIYNNETKLAQVQDDTVSSTILDYIKKQTQFTNQELDFKKPTDVQVDHKEMAGKLTDRESKQLTLETEYLVKHGNYSKAFTKNVTQIKNTIANELTSAYIINYDFEVPNKVTVSLPVENYAKLLQQTQKQITDKTPFEAQIEGRVTWLHNTAKFELQNPSNFQQSNKEIQKVTPTLGICWYENQENDANGKQVKMTDCFGVCLSAQKD